VIDNCSLPAPAETETARARERERERERARERERERVPAPAETEAARKREREGGGGQHRQRQRPRPLPRASRYHVTRRVGRRSLRGFAAEARRAHPTRSLADPGIPSFNPSPSHSSAFRPGVRLGVSGNLKDSLLTSRSSRPIRDSHGAQSPVRPAVRVRVAYSESARSTADPAHPGSGSAWRTRISSFSCPLPSES
jgi:hypothetical protein